VTIYFLPPSNSSVVDNGPRKPDASRTPRYIDTRMDEVYPVKKSRLRMLSVKDSAKVIIFSSLGYQCSGSVSVIMMHNSFVYCIPIYTQEITSTEQPISLKNITMLSTLAAKRRQLSWYAF
jgi:hypothetical protein